MNIYNTEVINIETRRKTIYNLFLLIGKFKIRAYVESNSDGEQYFDIYENTMPIVENKYET